MVFPTILGTGKRLFADGVPRRIKLKPGRGPRAYGSDGIRVQIYERAETRPNQTVRTIFRLSPGHPRGADALLRPGRGE